MIYDFIYNIYYMAIFASINEQRQTKIHYSFKFNYPNNVQNWTSTGYHITVEYIFYIEKLIKVATLQIKKPEKKI